MKPHPLPVTVSFLAEAIVTGKLDHPNIARLVDGAALVARGGPRMGEHLSCVDARLCIEASQHEPHEPERRGQRKSGRGSEGSPCGAGGPGVQEGAAW